MTEISHNQAPIYSVSELNKAVADLLSASFRLLWVAGEISNLARPRSGHIYFTLKDDQAQVRCALFKSRARYVHTTLDNGSAVRVRARVGLYAARGDYQLIVEHMEDDGEGALQREFERVKAKLDAEGLFNAGRKRPLPPVADRIGVITSATGAAVRDILRVVMRRFPLSAVRIYPVAVQGDYAATALINAIGHAGRRADCDVLIIARGGGSLEDLAAFNDESVARALASCPIPTVSGVGHEVDVTIVDLVADQRAATPSSAAEAVCPDAEAYEKRLSELSQRLVTTLINNNKKRSDAVHGLYQRLARQHPRRRLDNATQRLDETQQRLEDASRRRLAEVAYRLDNLAARHRSANPRPAIKRAITRVDELRRRLTQAQRRNLIVGSRQLAGLSRSLDSLSPLRTLDRGYAIARDTSGHIIRQADTLRIGDQVEVTLARGRLRCQILTIEPNSQGVNKT